jgi:hypothetical protein
MATFSHHSLKLLACCCTLHSQAILKSVVPVICSRFLKTFTSVNHKLKKDFTNDFPKFARQLYIHPLFKQTTQSVFVIHLHSMASCDILISLNLLLLDPQTDHSKNLLIPLPCLTGSTVTSICLNSGNVMNLPHMWMNKWITIPVSTNMASSYKSIFPNFC